MSLREVRQCVHDLTNTFQVALSALEMKEFSLALRHIQKSLEVMRRLQILCTALEEEERESIQ